MVVVQRGDSLPDESESSDVPEAKAPTSEVLAKLSDAGLSDAALDAIGGTGTARDLHRERARNSRRALRRVRAAAILQVVAVPAVCALVVAVLSGRVFDLSVAVSAVIGLAVFVLVMVLRGAQREHHS